MAKRKKPQKGKGKRPAGRAADSITVRRVPGRKVFELFHPPCAVERAEDIQEVRTMLEAGEIEVAVDELRWLLGGCNALLEAHQLLGQIAMDEGDLPLAQGHLGYAFELGLRALPKAGLSGPLPYARRANRPFLETAKTLAECLHQQGKAKMAADVVKKLLALDPSDPLDAKALLDDVGPSASDAT